MNNLSKKYFKNADDTVDSFINLLNCYEKMFYHALLDYNIDYKYIFCEDFNMTVANTKEPDIWVNTLKVNSALFKVNKYLPYINDIPSLLEKLLDSGATVAIRTMFDMLPPYVWYDLDEKRGKSNTHYCLFVAYDTSHYYFVEDPAMLKDRHSCKMKENNTISVLSKDIFNKAFQCFCEIIAIEVVVENFKNINNFEYTKNEIVSNYYKKTLNGKLIGKEAMNKLIKSVKDESYISNITKNFYWIYILHSRREIFKLCMEDMSIEYEKPDVALNFLNKNIIGYKKFYTLIAKHSVKPNVNITCMIETILNAIAREEEEMILALRDVKHK